MRRSNLKINASLEKQIEKAFAQVLADLKTFQESYGFLKDFFKTSELEAYSKRLAVAYWLKKGRSYLNIKNNLKVSTATIAEIAGMMKKKGFSLGIRKLEAEEWASQWAKKIGKAWPSRLKKGSK